MKKYIQTFVQLFSIFGKRNFTDCEPLLDVIVIVFCLCLLSLENKARKTAGNICTDVLEFVLPGVINGN